MSEQAMVLWRTRLRSCGDSSAGLYRPDNEDAIHADDARGIYFVIDGMGGHAAGEKAAEIAKERMKMRLERLVDTPDQRLREAITLANKAIFEAALEEPKWHGMACVLTAALVEANKVIVGHVGDSRLYKVTCDGIEKVTCDHSPVGELERLHEVTEEEALRHARRHEVYRDVGSQLRDALEPGFIDIYNVDLEDDAGLLLCSDGLSDALLTRDIFDIISRRGADYEAAVHDLFQAAEEADAKDNISVILAVGPKFGQTRAPALVVPDAVTLINDATVNDAAAKWARPPAEYPKTLPGPNMPPALSARIDETPIPEPACPARFGKIRRAAFVAWIAAGVLLTLGAQYAAPWLSKPQPEPPPAGPRILAVDPGRKTGYQSIAAAMDAARAGDTVQLAPAVYRERVVMKNGVTLEGGGAELALPAGISRGPAILADHTVDGSIRRLKIGDSAGPWRVGISVNGGDVNISRVEISGAAEAAIDIGGDATVLIDKSHLYANQGAGISLRDAARAQIAFTKILSSGKAPAISIASSEPSQLFENQLIAEAPAILQPKSASREMLQQNFFGPMHRRGNSQDVRVTGGVN